ncbi:hypothetical protein D5018_20150 [Parashewanella curva]|uniref:Uncharacterized protein n=1 Tax=Parashewanella curva TaxID=2338552 RepID=A0A3L8PU10_9GAMM|nr:hypothetical protein [Parashewanella curva]RLV57898.1 hypothetical protein D5018_20150 [Parashewanella curva]
MYSLFNLRYSELSFNEMMLNWESCFVGYQKEYELLISRFPNIIIELKRFSIFVTDKIYIENCSVFDFCLCRAMNQYLIQKSNDEFLALDALRKTLFNTALKSLKNISIIDSAGSEWIADENNPFKHWLDAQPQRYCMLQEGKLSLISHKYREVA